MRLFAVVQAKLGVPSTHLIDKTHEHVMTSIDILIDQFIVNKAVATIVKEEVRSEMRYACVSDSMLRILHTAIVYAAVHTVNPACITFFIAALHNAHVCCTEIVSKDYKGPTAL